MSRFLDVVGSAPVGAVPPCGRQALTSLAHLRRGHTFARLAAGFGSGMAAAHRYVTEAIEVLAALAPTLEQAMAVAATKAARTHDIPGALNTAVIPCSADTAHQGARPAARVRFRGFGDNFSAGQQAADRAHAKICAIGGQAMATLKSRWLLRNGRPVSSACSQATPRALAHAARSASRAVSSMPTGTRQAVEVEATGPNTSRWSACGVHQILQQTRAGVADRPVTVGADGKPGT